MMLAFGMVSALLEAQKSGKGQTVDVSMVEGASLLMSLMHSLKASGLWMEKRASNMLDGAAHFYSTYQTADNKYISFGAIEPQFMQAFIDKVGLDKSWLQNHINPAMWPKLKEELTALFRTKTSVEWQEILEGTDACFAPILPFWEAHNHPHNKARNSFIEIDGMLQPGPAPKFSRTKPEVQFGQTPNGTDTETLLRELGYTDAEITDLKSS